MTLAQDLLHDRYAQAVLSVSLNGRPIRQPLLSDIAWKLCEMNENRIREKGKSMSDDHLKQEAKRLANEAG